ncbi:MAG: peptidoglycan DD-metalloendopeptidase family protein [Chloroflexia bacterium]|nr:peptidoglycan DD-metalloendopeptidase family protein [Chloroflexia bacterium]
MNEFRLDNVTPPQREKGWLDRLILLVPILIVLAVVLLVLWSAQILLWPGVYPAKTTTPLPATNTPSPTATAVPTTAAPTAPPTATASATPTPTALTATLTPSPTLIPTPTLAPTPTVGSGELLLDAANTDRYQLDPTTLLHPHGLVVLEGTAYSIDAGALVQMPLQDGAQAQRLFPAGGTVEGITVGEWIALARSPDGSGLLLLDKRGDVYRYDPATDQWSIARLMDQRRTSPNPVPVALASYNQHFYLLDSAYSQIWRHPYDNVAEGYLPGGDAPWGRLDTALDLTRGMALTVDGDVFVLLREGTTGSDPALICYRGPTAEPDTRFAAGLDLQLPTTLYLEANTEGPLYVVDQQGRRLRGLDRDSGQIRQNYALPKGIQIRAVYAKAGRLYLLTPGELYVYPGSGQAQRIPGGAGPQPQDRVDLVELLSWGPFGRPIEGVLYLPERDSLLPGAPRVYRYGIHQGWDLYGGTMGIDIPYGTPVLAVADGTIVRADWDFREMTPDEQAQVLATCDQLHYTPPEILDQLRGRQIWVEHENGLVARYVHLSGIAEGIVTDTPVVQGQVLGYAGNSGTSESVAGTRQGVHLHFEFFLRGHYLGEGLSIVETRRLLQQLFFPEPD